jgi:hypothetical protein
MQTPNSKPVRTLALLGLLALAFLQSALPAQGPALIIDHTCIDLDKVPASYIEKAKNSFRIAYGHTSHGSQIISGMNALQKSNPELYAFGTGGGLSLLDGNPAGDLGNPDRQSWAQRTRELLSLPGQDRNVIMWSWCGQVSSSSEQDIQSYLKLMSELEEEFPNVRFLYMTGHLDGTGVEGNLNKRNEQIREFCKQNGKILFDFADIESYDPDGKVNYMESNAKDSCDYTDGGAATNWAQEWLAKNPEHGMALPDSAAHSEPLNGALKGRAFWWMMARMADWDGNSGS